MSARDVLKLCTLTFLPCAFVVFSPKESFLVLFYILQKAYWKAEAGYKGNHFENLRHFEILKKAKII